MVHPRTFRFGVQGRTTGTRNAWLELVHRVEDSGFSTFLVLDHFVRGFEPIAALGAAATATTSLRLGTMVIDNDFRHPAVLAKALATIDVLSNGRLEIGLGAGWLREEYEQTGIPFEAPGIRIERMLEAVHFMKRVFVEDNVEFSGTYYSATNLTMPPKPVQKPHPPILIGGGGKRVLRIAAQEANIVGFTSRALPDGSKDIADMTADAVARKINWVREAAGERFDDLELTCFASDVVVTDNRQAAADRLASQLNLSPNEILEAPYLLVGTLDEMEEELQRHREKFGISYYVVEEGKMDILSPLVARLAGQ